MSVAPAPIVAFTNIAPAKTLPRPMQAIEPDEKESVARRVSHSVQMSSMEQIGEYVAPEWNGKKVSKTKFGFFVCVGFLGCAALTASVFIGYAIGAKGPYGNCTHN